MRLGIVPIAYLLQTLAAHPALAAATAPDGLLAEAEQAHVATLRVKKRRRDWLLGRWTAKHLLQTYLHETTGRRLPLDALVIRQEADGAPALVPLLPDHEYLSLSISHSGDRAFCAVTGAPGVRVAAGRVGADVETVRPGLDEMARQFFTQEELAWLADAPAALHDTALVGIWSAKEAVLKALRLGLRADTRR
jgi:4'-phosphopantetheinyl transferase